MHFEKAEHFIETDFQNCGSIWYLEEELEGDIGKFSCMFMAAERITIVENCVSLLSNESVIQ